MRLQNAQQKASTLVIGFNVMEVDGIKFEEKNDFGKNINHVHVHN
jgi:hypothetical protein